MVVEQFKGVSLRLQMFSPITRDNSRKYFGGGPALSKRASYLQVKAGPGPGNKRWWVLGLTGPRWDWIDKHPSSDIDEQRTSIQLDNESLDWTQHESRNACYRRTKQLTLSLTSQLLLPLGTSPDTDVPQHQHG